MANTKGQNYMKNYLKQKREKFLTLSQRLDKCSKKVQVDGHLEIVPVEGLESEYEDLSRTVNSEAAKYFLADAVFNEPENDNMVNTAVRSVERLLESDEKFIYLDNKNIKNGKEYSKIFGEYVENNKKYLSMQEYLDLFNEAISKAIDSGKVDKEDLNLQFFNNVSRKR